MNTSRTAATAKTPPSLWTSTSGPVRISGAPPDPDQQAQPDSLATDCFTNKDDAHPKPLSVDYFTNKDDPDPSPLSVDYCTSAVDLPHIAPPVASSSSYGQVANLPHTAAFVLVGDADASLLPIQKSSL